MRAFTVLLADRKAQALTPSDSWKRILETIKGRVGSDKVEKIATEACFDALNLKCLERTPAAAKRLKLVMSNLGWTAVRTTSVTARGRATRVRGYARLADQ